MELWDVIKMVFWILVIIAGVISTQLMKHADRKAGRRWWEK